MNDLASNLVPKVHPLDRSNEADDPMELVANPVQGDPQFMLECMVQEFAWMGMDEDALMAMFASPAYPVLNELLACFGEEGTRQRIRKQIGQTGVFQFDETVNDEPEPSEDDIPLVSLTIPANLRRLEETERIAMTEHTVHASP